jgi:alanyl-tRNA synthetase
VNDLHGVARGYRMCGVLGAGDDGSVDFDRDGAPGEIEVLEELLHGDAIRHGAFFAVQRHDHRRNATTLARPRPPLYIEDVPTEKLYWEDPFLATFEARGARAAELDGKASVVLAKTAFYPEGGGQLADTGALEVGGETVRITDVQIDDAGEIHHLVDGNVPFDVTEDTLRGSVDVARRRDHMAHHTAQHMLSRALALVAKADTVSARLGATDCTIDIDLASIADPALARVEDLVNAVVRDDVPVRSLFPTPEELASMSLRRAPKVATGVRIIEVEGFDLTPCGGTHCTRTGQIGVVTVTGTEHFKGNVRVFFHAAGRALAGARAKTEVLRTLAGDFTCGLFEVPAAVRKMRDDLKSKLDALSGMRGELVELIAALALAAHPADPSGTTPIALVRPKDDLAMLRTLAGRLASRADVVAVCGAPDPATGDLLVVVQRGGSAHFDAGKWFKEMTQKHGGRGGGRAERAEGRLPVTVDLAKSLP